MKDRAITYIFPSLIVGFFLGLLTIDGNLDKILTEQKCGRGYVQVIEYARLKRFIQKSDGSVIFNSGGEILPLKMQDIEFVGEGINKVAKINDNGWWTHYSFANSSLYAGSFPGAYFVQCGE